MDIGFQVDFAGDANEWRFRKLKHLLRLVLFGAFCG